MSSLPLSLVGIVADSRTRSIILPYAFFVALLSFLGHKEWRFIIYIVPAFNIAAAVGLRHLTTWSKRAQNQAGKTLSFTILPSFLCINLLFTYLLSLTSQNNYPGGDALVLLHKLYPVDQYPSAHVHMCNLAAQTGASLFLQANAPPFPPFSPSNATTFSWTYDKTEHLSMEDLTAQQSITHLIVETRPDEKTKRDWEVVGSVWAFERWALDLGLVKESNEVEVKGAEGAKGLLDRVLKMVKQEKLWILHRKS
ncbi:hypothetical protein H0H93_016814 [Arthromyces matolae]|nr:hypothetical protein H0H93_016814 [Arthromyces matolae]